MDAHHASGGTSLSGGASLIERQRAERDMCSNGPSFALSEPFTLNNIDDAMGYQVWNEHQIEAGAIVREALTLAAKAILRSVPAGPYRTVAIRKLLEARMDANAAITFRGRF